MEKESGEMEAWVPFFEIFLKSPTPEVEAAVWLQQSFSASSTTTITASSFLSLLKRPVDVSSSSPHALPDTTRVMFIQSLPSMVQSRILSFLAYESRRFSARDLYRLATSILNGTGEVHFWVKKAARNLLDAMSELSNEWISGLSLKEGAEDEFESLPDWLKGSMGSSEPLFPWLPITSDQLDSTASFGPCDIDESSLNLVEETEEVVEDRDLSEIVVQMQIDSPKRVVINPELERKAASLKAQLLNFESTSKTVCLANQIRKICLEEGVDSFAMLGMLEPWKADDEIASVVISHLCGGSEDHGWPSQILCSIIFPKFLVLQGPVSRVLLTATLDYCKLHLRAAVYGLLFPLLLQREGINSHACDVMTRIVKECLHPGHVSAFCHMLLCGEQDEPRFICLPCQRHLISKELVWTESLFNLFQNILNHNVHLTQDSVDRLVHQVQELAKKFSKSLKFGNFLLCFVTKCALLLRAHKLSLTETVEHTNTLVTKSILSKLAAL